MKRATEVGRLLERAVLDTLHDFGRERGLSDISWGLVVYPEGNVVEGHPFVDGDVRVCEEWATAIGMSRYGWDTGDGVLTWHLDDGSFHLELTSAVAS